ncbi:MAG: hypothetical protein ACTHKY_14335 [Ginsengibacter sp.]
MRSLQRMCILIILLLPISSFSQDISGVWVGNMYNDTTRENIHYELAINQSDSKVDGYSHTTFMINGVKNIGVKEVKIKMKSGQFYVVDEKFIYNNYTEPPAKGVKMFSDLILSENDSAQVLSGSWKTNATRLYRPLTGTLYLEKKKKLKPEETIIVAKLIQLGLSDNLSFLSADVASNNIAKNNTAAPDKNSSSVSTPAVNQEINKQQEGKTKEETANEEVAKAQQMQKAQDDSIKAEQVKTEKAQDELAKLEQIKVQKGKDDSIKAEQVKAQKAKDELARLEQIKAQKAKDDSIKAEQIKAQKAKEEFARLEQIKVQKAKDDSIKAEQIKVQKAKEELARLEQIKVQKAKVDSIKAEQIKVQKAKEELAKLEQRKVQKAKVDSIKAEQLKAQKAKDEVARLEQIKVKKAKDDSIKAELVKTEKAKEQLAKEQELKAQKAKEEIAKAQQMKPRSLVPKAAADIEKRKIETIRTVEISQDSLVFSLYDNGTVDGDTVSVLMNGKVIWPRVGLLERAINKTIYLTPEMGDTISIVLYAENLGSIPPNTGLLVIREAGRIYEIRFSGDLNKNSGIILIRKKKE